MWALPCVPAGVSLFPVLCAFSDVLWKSAQVAQLIPITKRFDSWHAKREFKLAYWRFFFCFWSLKSPELYGLILLSCVATALLTLEEAFAFKNAYLITGVKPCYGGKSKSIHRNMIAAAAHEYINVFYIESLNRCLSVVVVVVFFYWGRGVV